MNSNLFKRYVWLVDTVDHAGRITFEEISNLWDNSPLNVDHDILALRTFHNHRDAIEMLFGVRILCHRKGGNTYSIAPKDSLGRDTKLKIWMLQTLSNAYSLDHTEDEVIASRVLAEKNPEEQFGLVSIMEAMNVNMCLHVTTSLPMTDDNQTEFVVEPYCVKFWGSSWYMLARDRKAGVMRAFDLAMVINIENTGMEFTYDENFKPEEFLRDYFGMDIDTEAKPVSIRVRISDGARDHLRIRPIHSSQKEVQAEKEASIFEFHLAPGKEFKGMLLSMGDDAEVLSPTELRDEMTQQVIRLARKYSRW